MTTSERTAGPVTNTYLELKMLCLFYVIKRLNVGTADVTWETILFFPIYSFFLFHWFLGQFIPQFIYIIAPNNNLLMVERDLFPPKMVDTTSWFGNLELLISQHILPSPLEFEVMRVDCRCFVSATPPTVFSPIVWSFKSVLIMIWMPFSHSLNPKVLEFMCNTVFSKYICLLDALNVRFKDNRQLFIIIDISFWNLSRLNSRLF